MWPPFITKLQMEDELKVDGLYYDIWQVLQSRLNFTTSVTKSSVPSGIWSSMTNSVKQKEYDLVLTGNSQTWSRSKFVDFSFAITPSTLRMFYLRDSESLNLSLYVNSFHSSSWIAVTTSLICLFVLVSSVIVLSNHFGITDESYNFGVKTLGAFLYLSHIGRRFPKEPQDISLRTAFVTISLSGFMIITLYRSMISASLAIKIYKPPINTIEEILHTPYNLMIANGSSVHDMFRNAAEDSAYKNIVNSGKLVPTKTDPFALQTIIEGWVNQSKVSCKSSLKVHFITESSSDLVLGVYQSIRTRSDYPCLITSVPIDYRKIGNGYIFQKDWPYKDLINFHLLKMYEEGIINSLSKKWIRDKSESSCGALVSNSDCLAY